MQINKWILSSALFCLHLFQDVESEDAQTGYFWHVTDFHYDTTYWTTGLSCNDAVPVKGQFGDYWCDSPWALVQDSIDAMADVKPDVDFLIWTGDNVAHIHDEHLSMEMNLATMMNLTQAVMAAFPNKTVYASLGNHDFFPSGQANYTHDEFYRRVGEMWQPWIRSDDQMDLFEKGGYWSGTPRQGLTVAALNTNLYYNANKLTKAIDDPAGQLAWLRTLLLTARGDGAKVMVTGHIPVGLLAPGLVDWFHPQHTRALLSLMYEFSDVIVASHFGHNHMDAFHLLQPNATSPEVVAQFTAPSVTPWRYKIPGQTGDAHNPGVRLVKYDRQTGKQLDYHQYYINLTDSNTRGRTQWTKLYTFSEAYGVPDMSATSLRQLFTRMGSSESSEAQRYCNNHVLSDTDKPCSQSDRADIYCGGVHPVLTAAQDCKTQFMAEHFGPGAASQPSLVGSLLFLVVFVMLL